jgi:peptidoglycan hydrolase-like protein with peptidoglycan-binding domain
MVRLGWPDPRRGEAYVRTFLGRAGGSCGLSLPVHRAIVPLVDRLCDGIVGLDVDLDAGRPDDWGFAWRRIRGSATDWSMHAYALAIDLDAIANPMGPRRTTFPVLETRELARSLGFRWGYDYANRPDAMHFEFMGSLEDAHELAGPVGVLRREPLRELDRRRDAANQAEAEGEAVPPTIREGSTDRETIRTLRGLLMARHHHLEKGCEGGFGPGLTDHVERFQHAVGLKPDGIVGPKTWRALGLFRVAAA